ncbi:MAG TPA: hypothetical protein VMU17_03590 [Elusimicrobiota bacterium]|nr:hypothetical protein [Elusimicrobiota bacterium]
MVRNRQGVEPVRPVASVGRRRTQRVKRANDPNTVWRLLDANFNRAREGLRVLEDSARFVMRQPAAARRLRELRHELDVLARIHYRRLLANRDVRGDCGRANPATTYTSGLSDLLAANFKRCEEALRVIEEYSRLLAPRARPTAQAIRFGVYHLEKRLCGARSNDRD